MTCDDFPNMTPKYVNNKNNFKDMIRQKKRKSLLFIRKGKRLPLRDDALRGGRDHKMMMC